MERESRLGNTKSRNLSGETREREGGGGGNVLAREGDKSSRAASTRSMLRSAFLRNWEEETGRRKKDDMLMRAESDVRGEHNQRGRVDNECVDTERKEKGKWGINAMRRGGRARRAE